MGDRAVDCARLESVCAERHRGFESPPIRQNSQGADCYDFANWIARIPFGKKEQK